MQVNYCDVCGEPVDSFGVVLAVEHGTLPAIAPRLRADVCRVCLARLDGLFTIKARASVERGDRPCPDR